MRSWINCNQPPQNPRDLARCHLSSLSQAIGKKWQNSREGNLGIFDHVPHSFAKRHPSYAREKNKTADSMVIGTHVLSFFVDVAVAKRHNFSCIVPMSAQLNEPKNKLENMAVSLNFLTIRRWAMIVIWLL